MTVIQWYPGHMNKAKNQIQARLKLVDIVLEIRDARLPQSSRNPLLDQIIGNKPKIIILNKSDLADPKITQQWQAYYHRRQQPIVVIDAQHQAHLPMILTAIQERLATKITKYQASGVKNYTIRAMCLGIPNVGKSTILNKLAGKKIAVTGNRPGVTKNQNWIHTSHYLDVLDTPGVLWPKIDDQEVAIKLALSGAIKDSLLSSLDLANFAWSFWVQHYPQILAARYHLSATELKPNLNLMFEKITATNEAAGDVEQQARQIIQAVRQGSWGRFTLDRVTAND